MVEKPSIALIDLDILLYETGFAVEAAWNLFHKDKGEEVVSSPPWDMAQESFEARIANIMEESECSEAVFAMTGKENFRNVIATTQEYKDRDSRKPFHYLNLKEYAKATLKIVCREPFEADDLISMMMRKHPGRYICCTRDKDLRQIPGWHYGWEIGKQPRFGPKAITEEGYLERNAKGEVKGGGMKFFYLQCLMGDPVDTIPGIPKYGPVTALKTLEACDTLEAMEKAVVEAYKGFYGDVKGMERLFEVANLVRMVPEGGDKEFPLWCPEGRRMVYNIEKRCVQNLDEEGR